MHLAFFYFLYLLFKRVFFNPLGIIYLMRPIKICFLFFLLNRFCIVSAGSSLNSRSSSSRSPRARLGAESCLLYRTATFNGISLFIRSSFSKSAAALVLFKRTKEQPFSTSNQDALLPHLQYCPYHQ